jgi:hypothetical protein
MPEATSDSLMGFGMPAQLSALLGGNPSALTTVGTTQTGAAVIKSKNTELVTAGGATAAVFPTTVGVMEPYFIVNAAATTGLVYVPSGHTLETASSGATQGLNGNMAVAQYKAIIMWQYKPKFWVAILTA